MALPFPLLLQTLDAAVKPSIVVPLHEFPPEVQQNRAMAELAFTPYRTISEWTGIPCDVFPEMAELSDKDWVLVTEAIFRVLDSMNIELVDIPRDLPPELVYEVLTSNWDHPVQYLPSSGFDLELCTGDDDTCPYGNYCDHSGPGREMPHALGGGLFNDDGTPVDITSIPVPALCLQCRSFLEGDAEENIHCLMTRHDQKDEVDFVCYGFEKCDSMN